MDLASPQDWSATRLPELAALESHLQCSVCKDILTAPVTTSCLHTFCSRCVRRYIALEQCCPACRSRESEANLRRVPALEEVVHTFTNLRGKLFEIVNTSKVSNDDDDDVSIIQSSPEVRKSRRKRIKQSPSISPSNQSQPQDHFPCPICARNFHESEINAHVDSCLANENHKSKQITSKSKLKSSNTARLPALNYSLLNEKQLRQRLQDLNIPTYGNKLLLQKRYSEWLAIYNANIDTSHPRSRRDLLRDLETWERAQGNLNKKREFDADQWKEQHKSEFASLISQARKQKANSSNNDDTNSNKENPIEILGG